MKWRKFAGWKLFEFCLLITLTKLLNLLPNQAAHALARGVGDLIYRFFGKRRKIALQNLQYAYGDTLTLKEKKKIANQSFQHLAVSIMEFFRMPVTVKEARERFEIQGKENLDQAFAKGKGVILVISHLGSWEYLAFLPYIWGYPCSVVVREIQNPYVDNWCRGLRKQTGLNPIYRQRSVREILRELKENHLVAVLIDQWAGHEGIWGDFFGHPTSTTSIPARLSSHTGAALVPAYCLRKSPGKYEIRLLPEVVPSEGPDADKLTTERLNKGLEEEIKLFPGQWTWGHRRWKDISRYLRNQG